MPGETLLVEPDDRLSALNVGFHRGDQIGLIGALPLNEEHELAGLVCCAIDPLRLETAVKASGAVVVCFLLLVAGRSSAHCKKTLFGQKMFPA